MVFNTVDKLSFTRDPFIPSSVLRTLLDSILSRPTRPRVHSET